MLCSRTDVLQFYGDNGNFIALIPERLEKPISWMGITDLHLMLPLLIVPWTRSSPPHNRKQSSENGKERNEYQKRKRKEKEEKEINIRKKEKKKKIRNGKLGKNQQWYSCNVNEWLVSWVITEKMELYHLRTENIWI